MIRKIWFLIIIPVLFALTSITLSGCDSDESSKIETDNIINNSEKQVTNENSDPTSLFPSTKVQVSKNLYKGLTLKVSKDIDSSVNRVALETPLGKKISLEAEVGDDLSGTMALKFKHNY